MKTAISSQLSAFSKNPVWQSAGCALRTIPFFRNPQGRRFPIFMVPRWHRSWASMKPTIAIIGGNGQMGRWFTRFFESQNCTVLVADVDTVQTSQEVAALADVVILAVPIPKVTEVAREVAPHLSPARRPDGPHLREAAAHGGHDVGFPR